VSDAAIVVCCETIDRRVALAPLPPLPLETATAAADVEALGALLLALDRLAAHFGPPDAFDCSALQYKLAEHVVSPLARKAAVMPCDAAVAVAAVRAAVALRLSGGRA
jgi:hypothetical protein